MNSEDMAKFIKSLDDEQRKAFEKVFKSVGSSMGVEVKEEKQDVPANNVNEDFRVTNSKLERGRTPVRARKNSWQDTGEWKLPEGEEEWEGGRKRATRSRAKAKKIKVECSVCGKTYMENPSLLYGEYHRCNRCGGR
jgi:formylmethanofuran dehydrogenase subunit E